MKIKIKVKEIVPGCMPEIIENGDWIDLKLGEDVTFKGPFAKALRKKIKNGEVVERYRNVVFDSYIARLGVAMEMEEGFEATVIERSSSFRKYGVIQTNSMGLIDNSYSSDEDEWKVPLMATRAITIPKGTRICQFRIQLSQKATFKQKMKWLLSSGIEIEKVDHLNNPTRGGFGSTDNKEGK